jgi:hypothetical protein
MPRYRDDDEDEEPELDEEEIEEINEEWSEIEEDWYGLDHLDDIEDYPEDDDWYEET